MHTTIRILNGWGLCSPLITTIATKGQSQSYKDKTICLSGDTKQVLHNWAALLEMVNQQPTPCMDLVPAPADYRGYCNPSRKGAGRVWSGLERQLPPIVWSVEFPQEIQEWLISQDNPKGTILNLDLEMAKLILQWLVLENFFADLAHTHVICWCDNTPTVSWAL